jgi:hypothetical protein
MELMTPYDIFNAQLDEAEDAHQLEAFRSNPPHFLTVSAKD